MPSYLKNFFEMTAPCQFAAIYLINARKNLLLKSSLHKHVEGSSSTGYGRDAQRARPSPGELVSSWVVFVFWVVVECHESLLQQMQARALGGALATQQIRETL